MSQAYDEQALDRLLAQVSRLHYERARALFQAIGLHRGQPPVIFALHERDGLTHSELATRLQVGAATISRMLQRMEKAGFLQCSADAADRRVSRAYLTPQGRAVVQAMRDRIGTMAAQTLAGVTPEEQEALGRLLQRIRDNLLRAAGTE